MPRIPWPAKGRRHACENHCPQELDHEKYFSRGLPAPCGCTPIDPRKRS
ncbi:hypothetical protein ACIQPT_16540 [Streptomyces sp. NPDC091289]